MSQRTQQSGGRAGVGPIASPKTVLAPQPCAVCVLLHLNSKGLHEDRGGFVPCSCQDSYVKAERARETPPHHRVGLGGNINDPSGLGLSHW